MITFILLNTLLLLVQLIVEDPLTSGSQIPPSAPRITHILTGTKQHVSTTYTVASY